MFRDIIKSYLRVKEGDFKPIRIAVIGHKRVLLIVILIVVMLGVGMFVCGVRILRNIYGSL